MLVKPENYHESDLLVAMIFIFSFFLVLVLVFALVERVAMINKKNNIEIF